MPSQLDVALAAPAPPAATAGEVDIAFTEMLEALQGEVERLLRLERERHAMREAALQAEVAAMREQVTGRELAGPNPALAVPLTPDQVTELERQLQRWQLLSAALLLLAALLTLGLAHLALASLAATLKLAAYAFS